MIVDNYISNFKSKTDKQLRKNKFLHSKPNNNFTDQYIWIMSDKENNYGR